jgi:hypothetical protein
MKIRESDFVEDKQSEIQNPTPLPKQEESVIFRLLGGDISTKHWKKLLLLTVLILVVMETNMMGLTYFDDAEVSSLYIGVVQDCEQGIVTPEELGYPDMSCEEIGGLWENEILFIISNCCIAWSCMCFGIIGIMGLVNAAFFYKGETSVELVVAQQELERLKIELGEVHTNLLEGVRAHQEVFDSKLRAEADYNQAIAEHSALIDAISQNQEGMNSELEAAAARAERNIEAAREAVEEAERARAEKSDAVRQFRAAEEELQQAVDTIEARATTVNITHKKRVYQDSVHQEDESRED